MFQDGNWPAVIKKTAHQIEFLFMKLQIKTFNSPLKAVNKAHTIESQPMYGGLNREPSMQSHNMLDQNYNNLLNDPNSNDIRMLHQNLSRAVRNIEVSFNSFFNLGRDRQKFEERKRIFPKTVRDTPQRC